MGHCLLFKTIWAIDSSERDQSLHRCREANDISYSRSVRESQLIEKIPQDEENG